MTDDPRADLVDRIEQIRDRWRRLVADVGGSGWSCRAHG